MARPLRIEFDGALYHVTARGNARNNIVFDNQDRKKQLELLGEVCGRFNWACYAYCLMDNHYHLLIETPDGNLSAGMRQLNGCYTQHFNRRHRRVGHLFQGRYKAILVEKDAYLLELSRYIVLNPVRARMVKNVTDWEWSSFREMIGVRIAPAWLSVHWLLSCFGDSVKQARKEYQQFVAAGLKEPSPMEGLKNQIYLGSALFIEQVQTKLDKNDDLSEVPKIQRRGIAKTLDSYQRHSVSRNEAMAMAYFSGAFSMREIGRYFGVHYVTVSRAVKAYEKLGGNENAPCKT